MPITVPGPASDLKGSLLVMQDPRIATLARTLLDHSCQLQAGDRILIEAFDLPEPALVCALVCALICALPFVLSCSL